MSAKKTGLELLRERFPNELISKLPKPTKQQTDDLRNNPKIGIMCNLCGGWHHPRVQHLDYVGHAALTDRLLDCDPSWTWEPLSYDDNGLPKFDANGGLWIKLTVCGVTRIGYGNAAPSAFKAPGDREKEVIGDCLRNAALRFGAALDLWSKVDLHYDEVQEIDDTNVKPIVQETKPKLPDYPKEKFDEYLPMWTRLIVNNKKSINEIIDTLSLVGVLSAEQKDTISNIKVKNNEQTKRS